MVCARGGATGSLNVAAAAFLSCANSFSRRLKSRSAAARRTMGSLRLAAVAPTTLFRASSDCCCCCAMATAHGASVAVVMLVVVVVVVVVVILSVDLQMSYRPDAPDPVEWLLKYA